MQIESILGESDSISTMSASVTNEEWDLLSELVDGLQNLITEIQNTIAGYREQFVTRKSIQEELCVGTEDEMTCITREQLDSLLVEPESASGSGEVEVSDDPVATESATL